MTSKNQLLWRASRENLEASSLWAFKKVLEEKYSLEFKDYSELHDWSVKNFQDFWADFFSFSEVIFEGTLQNVYEAPKHKKFYGGNWFHGVKLSYAENLLSRVSSMPLRAFYEEDKYLSQLSKKELLVAVKGFQDFLVAQGIMSGDKVVAYCGNNHLALAAFLAVNSLGAVWASCSPDFGEQGVVDRFSQLGAKLFLYDEKTVYNKKTFDLNEKAKSIQAKLNISAHSLRDIWGEANFNQIINLEDIHFERVVFSHPLYVLFSSGTTGTPKAIVHSVGGTLLQHIKEHSLHSDLKKDERFFYYTTTGWMMWNWMLSGLYMGVELFTLEGAPMVGDWTLWDFVEKHKISAFGTSARFIAACRAKGLKPKVEAPRITFSTGSPLLPEDFDYYYSVIDPEKKSQLASISGGTDIVSCFMLGNPWKPVLRGEIQAAGLGMDIDALDENLNSLRNKEGELVCKTPFPSMPTSFLNDEENKKFEEAYFSKIPGMWHHGDYVCLTDEGGVIVHGRSDTTLNPGGVRIGTAEIYRVVEQEPQVADSLVVGKVVAGDEKVVLFVKLASGELTDELQLKLKSRLKSEASPRHVPDYIIEVQDIPYTLSGKKVELAVKKILKGEAPKNLEALQNPDSLKEFEKFAQLIDS